MQINIQHLVASRLEDMADQVEQLYAQGEPEMAEFLREEGLALAKACDNDETFLYIADLKTFR